METKPPYLHLLILFLILCLVGFLFLRTEKKIEEINLLLNEVNLQSENVNKLAVLASTLPTLSDETKVYLKTLPATESEVATFAAVLESMAREDNLSIVFHFDDFVKPVEVSSQKMNGLGIGVDLNGGFEPLTEFVKKLSSLPYFFKIDKMTITKNENRSGMKAVLNGYLMMNIEKK